MMHSCNADLDKKVLNLLKISGENIKKELFNYKKECEGGLFENHWFSHNILLVFLLHLFPPPSLKLEKLFWSFKHLRKSLILPTTSVSSFALLPGELFINCFSIIDHENDSFFPCHYCVIHLCSLYPSVLFDGDCCRKWINHFLWKWWSSDFSRYYLLLWNVVW